MSNHRYVNTLIASLLAILAAPAVSSAADNPGITEELFGNFNFILEIEGATVAGFNSVSGLSAELEVVEFREGGENSLVHKLPGDLKYSNIVLKRGYVSNDVLHDWVQATLHPDGVLDRRDGSLILQDRAGNPIVRYDFYEGWPCKWKGFSLGGDDRPTLVEEIVICIDWFEEG